MNAQTTVKHEHNLSVNLYGADRVERILAEMTDDSIMWAGGGKNRNLVHLISGTSKTRNQPLAVCGQWVGNKKRQPAAEEKVCSKCQRGQRTSFSTFNQPRECMSCGKMFADNASRDNTDQTCGDCYEIAGIENAHQDGYHKDAPDADCPMCQDEPEAAVTEQPLHIHCDEHIKRLEDENEKLRAALRAMMVNIVDVLQ